jgi:hypothetical protein
MELAAAALTSIAGAIGSVFTTGAAGAGAATGLLGEAMGVTAATAAGAAVPAAASGLSSAFGVGSVLTGILSGGASIAGMLGAQASAAEKANAYNLAAEDTLADIPMQELAGTERRTSMKAAMLQAIGERDVAFAASGTDISFGTPTLARDQAQQEGERAFTIDLGTEGARIARLKERAINLRLQAGAAKQTGFLQSLGLGATTLAGIGRRG